MRKELIQEVADLPPAACLEHLAWDDTHALSYYPASLAEAANGAWEEIAPETRAALLRKASEQPRGAWRSWWNSRSAASPGDPPNAD